MVKARFKSLVLASLLVAGALLLLTQLQAVVLRASGAVDGDFGVRPMSHRCYGFTLAGREVPRIFPSGDVRFHFINFHFRYRLWEEDRQSEHPICFGQDIWFGE